jgi:hypothetical protein
MTVDQASLFSTTKVQKKVETTKRIANYFQKKCATLEKEQHTFYSCLSIDIDKCLHRHQRT